MTSLDAEGEVDDVTVPCMVSVNAMEVGTRCRWYSRRVLRIELLVGKAWE